MGNNREEKLQLWDFEACARCKYFGIFGTHAETIYCKKDHPDPYKSLEKKRDIHYCSESPTKSIYDITLLGCSRFEWNGMPVNRKAHKKIMEDEKFKGSVLRNLEEDVLTDLTAKDILKNNGIGECFNQERFEIIHSKK
ncbi:MAG: hypothetical protein AABW50_02845 [Nanoarchaeota archaeon]